MKNFKIPEKAEIISFMKSYNFARIITMNNPYPTETQLYFLIKEKEDEIYLHSRFARANKQWRDVITNDVMVIFAECAVSIIKTEQEENTPAWNYTEIHAYGKGEIITDKDDYQQELDRIIAAFETEYKMQWDCLPLSYREKMLTTIIPFKIRITDMLTERKISKNSYSIKN